MKPFNSVNVDSKASLDEVSQRIRGAMRERGRKRESEGGDTEESFDMVSDGQMTPGSEDGDFEIENKKVR
jgi:glycerol-3-phosphate O-acyltransferase/dihydroxyacetone phosphate acyltransferase